MSYPSGFRDQRRDQRVNAELNVRISIGSQLSIQGQLKDISSSSAFIKIKNSIYLQSNDEVGFAIQCSPNQEDVVQGMARVSRLVPGEGFVIYFIKMDDSSSSRLKKLLQNPPV